MDKSHRTKSTKKKTTKDKAGIDGLGARIEEKREEHGLSCRALAKACGVSDFAIRSWESGKTYPDARNLDALGKALEVEVSWLGGWAPIVKKT